MLCVASDFWILERAGSLFVAVRPGRFAWLVKGGRRLRELYADRLSRLKTLEPRFLLGLQDSLAFFPFPMAFVDDVFLGEEHWNPKIAKTESQAIRER